MADGTGILNFLMDDKTVNLETAIELIESGKASETLVVDLGGGSLARADGRNGLQGLLQRLRGHRLLMRLAQSGGGEPLRAGGDAAGLPDVDPDVGAILDALKGQS